MQDGYCPVTLRKKNPSNRKPPRSQSAPRRSYSSLAVRNLNSNSIRSQKVDEIRKEIEEEKKSQAKPAFKNLKPAIRHKRETQIWDDEGCLIDSSVPIISQNEDKRKSKNHSKMNQKSKEILHNCGMSETSEKSIINRIRPPSRAQSALSMRRKKTNMDEFFDRQVSSVRNRERSIKHQQSLEKQKKKSYMNDESKKILSNSKCSSDLLSSRKAKKQEEYSFHPDMSLTLNRSVKISSNKANGSRKVFREIDLLESKMEEEAKEMAECTFAPDLSLTQKSNRKMVPNREQFIQFIQRNEASRKRSTQSAMNKDREENKNINLVKDVPKRTRYINELLSGLRTPPCC